MPSYATATALKRVQYDPAPDGSVTAQAFFETTVTNVNDPADVAVKPWQSVTFTLSQNIVGQIEQLAIAARDA